jgi:hypothetical protein
MNSYLIQALKQSVLIIIKQKNINFHLFDITYHLVTYSPFVLLDKCLVGEHGCVVVKALCYKPEGCGFDTR